MFLLRSLTVAVFGALALAAVAHAHLDVRPRVLESGKETTLLVELPELRQERFPTGLDVGGSGIEQLSSRLLRRAGVETRWRVRVRVSAPAGPLVVPLTARFADGRVIRAEQTLTIVPARDGGNPWLTGAAATAVLGIVVATAAVLLLLRRRNFGKES